MNYPSYHSTNTAETAFQHIINTNIKYKQVHSFNDFPDTNEANLFLPDGLFQPSPLIVCENMLMTDWIKYKVADRLNIAAGMDNLVLPSAALRRITMMYPGLTDYFSDPENPKYLLLEDDLQAVILLFLKNITETDKDFNYLWSCLKDTGEDSAENKLMYMSEVLASLFRQYSLEHPDIIRSWMTNKPYSKTEKLKSHEEWQRTLWQKIFKEDGPYVDAVQCYHIAEKGSTISQDLLPRIIYIGSKFPGQLLFDYFSLLSKTIDVYWLSTSSLPEGYTPEGYFKHWFKYDMHMPKAEPSPKPKSSHKAFNNKSSLQTYKAFIKGELNEAALKSVKKDNTFTLARCPGRMRQAEVIKNRIINLLEQNSGITPSDIAIMLPDPGEFMPVLEPVLNGVHDGHPMAWALSGGDELKPDAMTAGFLELLRLPGSRFDNELIKTILTNPCFAARAGFSRDIADDWSSLIEDVHIRHGYNAEHRKQMEYVPDQHNTWEHALNRILLGFTMDHTHHTDDTLKPAIFSVKGQTDILPFPAGSTGEKGAALQLFSLIKALFQDFYPIDRLEMPLSRWTDLFRTLCNTYLKPRFGNKDDNLGMSSLNRAFRSLAALEKRQAALGIEHKAGYKTARSFLEKEFKRNIQKKGRLFTGGVSCGRLEDLSVFSYKAVFIPGLNEGAWPRTPVRNAFDLSSSDGEDISVIKDRWSFYQAIEHTTDNLMLLYDGKSNITDEEVQPASPLAELLNTLTHMQQKEKDNLPVEKFPTASFSIENFNKIEFPSFNQSMAKAAVSSSGEKHVIKKTFNEYKPQPPYILDISDIEAFLNNPAKVYLRKVPGIYIDDLPSSPDSLESEEFDFFSSYNLTNRIFPESYLEAYINNTISSSLADYMIKARLSGCISGTPLSIPAETALSSTCTEMEELLQTFLQSEHFTPDSKPITFYKTRYIPGGADQDNIEAAPEFHTGHFRDNREAADLLKDSVIITGEVTARFGPGQYLGFSLSKSPNKIYLRLYLQALLGLAADTRGSGHSSGITLHITGKKPLSLSITAEEARDRLFLLTLWYYKNLQKPIPCFFRMKKENTNLADSFENPNTFHEYELPWIERVFPQNPFPEDQNAAYNQAILRFFRDSGLSELG
jgi:exonuclease V gamma subunit